jgi:hypothetical protein
MEKLRSCLCSECTPGPPEPQCDYCGEPCGARGMCFDCEQWMKRQLSKEEHDDRNEDEASA